MEPIQDDIETLRRALSYPQSWLYPNAHPDLKAERDEASAALDRLVAERDALQEERDTFMRDRREYKALAGDLEAERDRAKNSLHNTTGTMEVWKRRCLGAEAERDRLREALERIANNAYAQRSGYAANLAREALTTEEQGEAMPDKPTD